ncbi:MAG: ferrous iron transport protein A [Streptosporangiales bacterium]|nr:ferrous iron transport protein A [Streptosporangiales bacterium]
MTLDQLRQDDHATVVAVDSRGGDRRRLMDLGLLPGTKIRVHMKSPLGDPTAYLVRGSVVALRRSQARHIRIEAHDAQEPT